MEPSDSQLVAEYLSGNDDAYERLLRRYLRVIYNFVFRLTHNQEEASDLTQEVFIKVWQNLGKFNQEKNFQTWIFTIARNVVIDHWRKLGRREIPLTNGEKIPDARLLPEEKLWAAENRFELNTALQKLPDEHREIVTRHSFDEQTFAEISQLMNKPLNTVKSIYRRALHQMRKFLRIN